MEELNAVLPEGLPTGMVKEFDDSMRSAVLVRQSFLDLRDNFRRIVDPPLWLPNSKGLCHCFLILWVFEILLEVLGVEMKVSFLHIWEMIEVAYLLEGHLHLK